MRTVSLVVRKNPVESFYNPGSFVEYLKSNNPARIFITVKDNRTPGLGREITKALSEDRDLKRKIVDVSEFMANIGKAENEFNMSVSHDAGLLAKKKMLDMFTVTIYSYLTGTWKDFETLNSPDTHAIFKARFLLMSSILPDYVSAHYTPVLESLKERITELAPRSDDVAISDVEWSFWFRDNIG